MSADVSSVTPGLVAPSLSSVSRLHGVDPGVLGVSVEDVDCGSEQVVVALISRSQIKCSLECSEILVVDIPVDLADGAANFSTPDDLDAGQFLQVAAYVACEL
jgi:hypothetical protein